MKSLYLISPPWCVPLWLEPIINEVTDLKRTYKIGGLALQYSSINMPFFCDPKKEPWKSHTEKILLALKEGFFIQDCWYPRSILQFQHQSKIVFFKPSFEEVVYKTWAKNWAAPFKGNPPICQKILQSRAKSKSFSEASLEAIIEGYHWLYPQVYSNLPCLQKKAILLNPKRLFDCLESFGYQTKHKNWDWRQTNTIRLLQNKEKALKESDLFKKVCKRVQDKGKPDA